MSGRSTLSFDRDPPYRFEGMYWIRTDLVPPVTYYHRGGIDYAEPWVLAKGEQEAPPPGQGPGGSGTTATFRIAASADDQNGAEAP